jgi:hypothetical protein
MRAARQAEWARRQYYATLAALRPDAVGLVDAFGFSDYALNSALGRADGDVYRALLAAAQVGFFRGFVVCFSTGWSTKCISCTFACR